MYGRLGSYGNLTEKKKGLVWSGASGVPIRDNILGLVPRLREAVGGDTLVDIQATLWKQNSASVGGNQADRCMTLGEMCSYKYQVSNSFPKSYTPQSHRCPLLSATFAYADIPPRANVLVEPQVQDDVRFRRHGGIRRVA